MADQKISALTAATTPLAGTEVLPIVQSSTTVKASIANIQAAPVSVGTANAVQYLNGSKVPSTSASLIFDGTNFGLGGTPSAWISTARAFQIGTYSSFYEQTKASVAGNNFRNPPAGGSVYLNSDLASAYVQEAGKHQWYNAPTGIAGNAVSFTLGMSLDASSNLSVVGNVVMSTSGKGIDFSATPGTGTSELLADYEEGTWTPGFAAWTTAPTINASYCRYTKVGRQVTILMLCQNGVCGSTGQPITGLPFTSNSVSVASFRDASGAASTTFGVVDIGTQITSITAVSFTGLFWGMSATYFV